MLKTLLLGTSRLHRPFARNVDRQVQLNSVEGVTPVYAKAGYFHTAAEIVQVIRHARHPELLPRELRSRAYRIEPRATTPLNEFDAALEQAIRAGEYGELAFTPDDVDVLIMEVSSLTVNTYVPTGHVLHTNPNFSINAPYSELYPEGYYAKYESTLPVRRSETSLVELTAQLYSIRAELPQAQVLALGHLRSASHPNAGREQIHRLSDASEHERGLRICGYGTVPR